jgi:hypothetical protein
MCRYYLNTHAPTNHLNQYCCEEKQTFRFLNLPLGKRVSQAFPTRPFVHAARSIKKTQNPYEQNSTTVQRTTNVTQ